MTTQSTLPKFPARPVTAHKGTFGHTMIVGGATGMSGAAILAGCAALRTGSGLVTLGAAPECGPIATSVHPCLMSFALPAIDRSRMARDDRQRLAHHRATVVACGPGLGKTLGAEELARWLYTHDHRPLVMDADGLNALARRPSNWRDTQAPRIVTPHLAEFRRMLGEGPSPTSIEQLREVAVTWAAEHQVILVLKGHRTLVTDGQSSFENSTGNPGMATAGTGDVLTGVIVSLLGQGLAPFAAAQLGVYLHGLAGDLAAARLGCPSLNALDVIHELPTAIQQRLREEPTSPENEEDRCPR